MKPIVINIAKKYECLLPFLFPTYSVCLDEECYSASGFITHRDIESKAEREMLDFKYSDCVIISQKIFDEMWDEKLIAEKALEFSKVTFKNRKKSIKYETETFVDDIINGIFMVNSDEEEAKVSELFNLIGSAQLLPAMMQLSKSMPIQKINSAILTFISKIDKDAVSPNFKRAYIRFGSKLDKNKMKAISEMSYRGKKDEFGLSTLKLIQDLFT